LTINDLSGFAFVVRQLNRAVFLRCLWGLWLREWQGVSPKTLRTFGIGLGLILASIVLVGIGNSIPN
jgi:hypothetical protein